MFECKVINYGYGRMVFPTRIGNLYIDRLKPYKINDRGVMQDLRRFEFTDKLGFEVVVDDENGQTPIIPTKSGIDYVAYSINELRSIAAGKGVKKTFFMKKDDLIKILEEV